MDAHAEGHASKGIRMDSRAEGFATQRLGQKTNYSECKRPIENDVIVLPCKIGTPLYFLSGNLEECEIIESSSWSYIIDSFGLITIEETLHELSYKNNYEYVFGSTVFSIREEAEKALYKI